MSSEADGLDTALSFEQMHAVVFVKDSIESTSLLHVSICLLYVFIIIGHAFSVSSSCNASFMTHASRALSC